MTPKEKISLQRPEREVRGAGQLQTLNMMIIRGNTQRQSDDKGQSNHPDNHLKRRWDQRGGPVVKITQTMADRLRIHPVKLGEARDDTRPEGGEDEHTIRTTDLAPGTGTRCQRARRHRQVRLKLPETFLLPVSVQNKPYL